MSRKQALGRGLAALLPGRDDVPRGTFAREVELDKLVPSRFQPRRIAPNHPAAFSPRVTGGAGCNKVRPNITVSR